MVVRAWGVKGEIFGCLLFKIWKNKILIWRKNSWCVKLKIYIKYELFVRLGRKLNRVEDVPGKTIYKKGPCTSPRGAISISFWCLYPEWCSSAARHRQEIHHKLALWGGHFIHLSLLLHLLSPDPCAVRLWHYSPIFHFTCLFSWPGGDESSHYLLT